MRRTKDYLETRESQILDMINTRRSVSVQEVADAFHISPSTVRKQINALSDRGLLVKTYGGASANPVLSETSTIRHLEEKQRVARLARKQIHDDEVILIGAGSTTNILASLLHDANRLTVVTNSVIVAAETMKNPHIDTRICGGIVRSKTGGVFGMQAVKFLEEVHGDKVFISPDSISVEYGVGDFNAMVSFSQQAMIHSARELYILADATKIGLTTYSDRIAGLDQVSCLITNTEAPVDQLNEFRKIGLKVLLA